MNLRATVSLSGSTWFLSPDKGVCQTCSRQPPHCSRPFNTIAVTGKQVISSNFFLTSFLNPILIQPKRLDFQHKWVLKHIVFSPEIGTRMNVLYAKNLCECQCLYIIYAQSMLEYTSIFMTCSIGRICSICFDLGHKHAANAFYAKRTLLQLYLSRKLGINGSKKPRGSHTGVSTLESCHKLIQIFKFEE
jgi:hypothetical protein